MRAGGPRNATHKTAVEASRRIEESDGVVVPRKAVKAAGGKGPDSMMRLLQERDGDCGDTRNPSTNPGPATGAVPASQEGTALPRLRDLRQGVSPGHAGACLRCSRANGGAPGPDGVTFEEIELRGGSCCWRSCVRS